ncbi:hypothetical protein NGM99_16225 [Mesorhizobium sp. RP14(2022)]|uniref:Porin n=1 Tax=Mesorhizobium liriopis TaxID=2953882 RepID=A0ABT1CAV4_9HYPH|nr:hypothetical protein [Mesorhizobium liriopis]MCO6051331.1 hypothetical protein [Mesorhizobium liriopis]
MRAVIRLFCLLSLLAGLMMPAGASAFEPKFEPRPCPSRKIVEASCIDVTTRAALAPSLPEPQCQTQGLAVDTVVLAPRPREARITFFSTHETRAGHSLFAVDPPPRA